MCICIFDHAREDVGNVLRSLVLTTREQLSGAERESAAFPESR